MLGAPEMFWIALVFLLLFGAKKLPELARSMGEGLREFKKATREAMEEPAQPVATPVDAPRRMETPLEETKASISA